MAPSQSTLITNQPFRTLYKLLRFTKLGFTVPLWLLKFTVRSSRPDPTWTLRQTVSLRILHELLDISSKTETPSELSLKPGKEQDRFKVIEPAQDTFYKGPLLSPEVRPATIGGTWFPKPIEKASDVEPDAHVVLHIHGGAFVLGNGRTGNAGFLCTSLLKHGGGVAAVFSPQYRLSCRPTSAPFPAALQDVLTSYLHLVRGVGIPPERLTVSGDSAGGNLVIAFLRYLAYVGETEALGEEDIPLPGSAVLISPWVAPAAYLDADDAAVTQNPHYATDYLPPSFTRWGARVYASGGTPATDPYITPLGHPFRTEVPIFVNLAPGELLAGEVTSWVEEMSGVDGNSVEVSYEEGAPHDTLLAGNVMGWAASAEAVAARVGVFVRETAGKAKGASTGQ